MGSRVKGWRWVPSTENGEMGAERQEDDEEEWSSLEYGNTAGEGGSSLSQRGEVTFKK